MLSVILMVFAFVLFVVAGLYQSPNPPWSPRFVCWGLACWVLADLVTKVPILR